QKILANESVFLLDIRKNEDYNDWSIQGRNVHSMNIPFKHLENETEKLKHQLPENQTINVGCAKGISSQRGGEILEEARVIKRTVKTKAKCSQYEYSLQTSRK